MEGYRTWTGIILAILGTLGAGKIFGDENVSGIVNTVATLVGFLLAAYGNWKAHQKISKLKNGY